MAMLSASKVEHIRLEEVLRNDIRTELAKQSSGNDADSRLWKFLNS